MIDVEPLQEFQMCSDFAVAGPFGTVRAAPGDVRGTEQRDRNLSPSTLEIHAS